MSKMLKLQHNDNRIENFSTAFGKIKVQKAHVALLQRGDYHYRFTECLMLCVYSFLHIKGSSTWNVNVGLPAWNIGMSIFISFACLQRLMKSDLLFKNTLSELPSAASLK